VPDVSLYKAIERIVGQRRQVFEVARIGQRIQVDNPAGGIVGNKGMYEVGADKSGATCHDNGGGGKCHGEGFPFYAVRRGSKRFLLAHFLLGWEHFYWLDRINERQSHNGKSDEMYLWSRSSRSSVHAAQQRHA